MTVRYGHFTKTVVKWLETEFLQSGCFHYSQEILEKYHRILKTRGKREAIRFCKERRASIYQWLTTISSLDDPVKDQPSVGLPKDLRFLKYSKNLSYPSLRLILSSLYCSRGLELPPSPNVESIVSAPVNGLPDSIGNYVDEFWYTLGYRHKHADPQSVYWRKFHLSTKSGPNGQVLWSALADLSVLPNTLIEDIKVIGGKRLTSRIETLLRYLPILVPIFKVVGRKFRKVSAIPDQEGKTREVAILDYWSQTALRGLHQYLFNVLRKIHQDCTFNQGGFRDKVSWNNGHLYHSVDLSTATDRFPIELISLVLKGRFSDKYVNSWRNIMVGYPFDSVCGPIRYAAGNPMGAYSSWASFALAHHYVMFYCCKRLKLNWLDAPYVLLGDDIVIKHDALAQEYMNCMTQLGVEFSLQKSHISPYMFEFAKRIFHQGTEITPFPIAALWTTRNTPSLMLNVLVNEVSKGWASPKGTPAVLSDLYSYLGFNATYVARKRKIFYISHQVMMGLSGCMTAGESVKTILVEYYPEILKHLSGLRLPNNVIEHLAAFWFMKMLRDSLLASVSSSKEGKPLGLIAEELVCFTTGRDDTAMDAFDLIQALPVLQIHGQVEETYMKVVKGGDEQLKLAMAHDWKSVLRTLTIPISDQIYVSRNQELMVHASFTLGKILQGILESIKGPNDIFSAMKGGLRRPF